MTAVTARLKPCPFTTRFMQPVLVDAYCLLFFLGFGHPGDGAPAKQGEENHEVKQRLSFVALYQPVEVDGSGGGRGVDETMEAEPTLSQGADCVLRGGEREGQQEQPG